MSTKPKLSERDLERACTDLLALDGWRCLKTDPVSRREWGKGFGEKGMADCLYIRYSVNDLAANRPAVITTNTFLRAQAQVLWVEWKTPRGKVAPHQNRWHEAERRYGALTWIAGINFYATYEEFLAFYRGSGLNRRPI